MYVIILGLKSIAKSPIDANQPEKKQLPDISVMETENSGSCGDNVSYAFNESNGRLVISGSGFMDSKPWSAFKLYILSVDIDSGVENIVVHAFSGCSSLKSINISESVTSIGDSSFSGCFGLTSVDIPVSVTSIGVGAFSGCSGLKSINILCSNTSIGVSAFSGCSGITSIEIPDGVTSIGVGAFSGCSELISITVPKTINSIGDAAFSGCSGLSSVNIPRGASSIGNSAFHSCTGLESINIPSTVTSIGDSAFAGCSALTLVAFFGKTEPNHGNNIFEFTPLQCVLVTGHYLDPIFCGILVKKLLHTQKKKDYIIKFSRYGQNIWF